MLRATNRSIVAYFDAIKNLRLRQLALILKAGYDPNLMVNARGQNGLQYMVNYFGATDAHFRLQAPLNKAAYLSIAKLLLDSGIDPNTLDLLSGETVIFDAIRFDDKDIVSLLLNYVDLSLRNKSGETAIMCAARFGSKQVMRMILEHLRHLEMDGYFLRQRNRFGLTALELARAENLECAKVLTKHLVAFGHHTGAVLARSSSHHQLLPRSLQFHMRGATGFNPRQSTAALFDDSNSDYDSDVFGGPFQAPVMRSGGSRPMAAGYNAAAFYDPKAAEFNQYLLEQQELAGAEQQSGATGAGSDDEDYFARGNVASTSSGLTRSRSCLLGPSAGGKQQKYSDASGGASKKSSGAVEVSKMGPSWDRALGGRNTVD